MYNLLSCIVVVYHFVTLTGVNECATLSMVHQDSFNLDSVFWGVSLFDVVDEDVNVHLNIRILFELPNCLPHLI